MFSIAPVERSSSACTSWPASRSASERWEPMKPAPPVISTRIAEYYHVANRKLITLPSCTT